MEESAASAKSVEPGFYSHDISGAWENRTSFCPGAGRHAPIGIVLTCGGA